MSDSRITLIVSLWLEQPDVAAFEAFERQAAAVMARHGGRIESVVRCSGDAGEPFEVHVVTFPNAAALAAYRGDPRMADLRPLRERLIARTQIWSGEQRSPYGARPADAGER
jgi:antibiotic biosynthesis monooxygenase (ABM) superfamily enzyme